MKDYKIFSSSGPYSISVDTAKEESYIVCPICSPYRSDAHKSEKKLNVNISKEVWRCNHCGEGGRIYDKSEQDIRKELIIKRGITPLEKQRATMSNLDDKIMRWVTDVRKISEKAMARLRWKSAVVSFPDDNGNFVKKTAIAFPVHIDGTLINIHYRDNAKHFMREKSADTVPYNWDSIQGKKKAIIVEGEMDVGAIYTADDYENGALIKEYGVTSVPNGTTVTEAEASEFKAKGTMTVERPLKLDWVSKVFDDLRNVEEIIIATDSDAPGYKLRNALAKRLGIDRCKFVDFTHRRYDVNGVQKICKDSNDVLRYIGVKELCEDLRNPKLFPSPNIIDPDELTAEIDDYYENGVSRGLTTGYPALDPHFTISKGMPYCVYGWPNMGKTTDWLNICMNMAVIHGWTIALYCPENYPVKLIASTLMEIYVGKTFDKKTKNDNARMSSSEYLKARNFVAKRFIFFSNNHGFTFDELMGEIKIAVRKHDVDMVFIDPWNSLNDTTTDNDSMMRKLSGICRIAEAENVAIVISVHPNTPDKKMDESTPPSWFQLEGGSIWSKKMYSMICFHQRRTGIDGNFLKEGLIEVHITKNKWWKILGVPTTVASGPILLKFNKACSRMLNADGTSPISSGSKAVRTKEDKQLEMEIMLKQAADDNQNNDWK